MLIKRLEADDHGIQGVTSPGGIATNHLPISLTNKHIAKMTILDLASIQWKIPRSSQATNSPLNTF